jgi:hypothetical protein
MKTDLSHSRPVRDAAFTITQASGQFCGADVLRRAARRIGALHLDGHGRAVIPLRIIQSMAINYRALGYLIRRGQNSVEPDDADALSAADRPSLQKAS